jgi:methylated-DNA-[protein]-cysteine S-methyltransferase
MAGSRQPLSAGGARLDSMSSRSTFVAEATAIGDVDTQVGRLVLTSTARGLARLDWSSRTERSDDAGPAAHQLSRACDQLSEYFAGRRRTFDVALDWDRVATVPRAVLQALSDTVGFGETVTYGELARRSGTGIPARGIGAVMGANPFPLVVPCHRVVASDGLGGYSGGAAGTGVQTKRWLLTFEGALDEPLGWDPTLDLVGRPVRRDLDGRRQDAH